MVNAGDKKVEDGGRRTDRISNLPKEILYCILYFLSKREAAQTCVLSKSWRYLWTNRLTVSYSERSPLFNGPHRTRLFISRINKALQAYLGHNHSIEEFHLSVTNSSESVSLLKNWIPMLTAIGVKELFLSIRCKRRSRPYADLPPAVFKSERLASLHLRRCNLSLQRTTRVEFVRLKELDLTNVNFTDEHIFEEIISSCHLITTMCFEECQGLKTIKLLVDDKKKLLKYLKHFTFINEHTYRRDQCSIEIHAIPTLEKIYIFGSKIRLHGHKFDNLKELSLIWMKFSSNSWDCSSCYEFPRLRILKFSCCDGWEQFDQPIRINAPKMLWFRNAPRTFPYITFTTLIPRECRSEVTLRFCGDPQSWFLKLSGLLQTLSHSQIFLSVHQNPMHNLLMNIEELDINNIDRINNSRPVAVEELGLNMGHLPSFPSFLNGLFSICRPRYIDQSLYLQGEVSERERDHKELTEFLCKFLMKSCDFTRQQDLEELRIESFDTSREQWLPTMMMSECAAILPESNRIRFRLKWSEAAVCESSSNKRRRLE